MLTNGFAVDGATVTVTTEGDEDSPYDAGSDTTQTPLADGNVEVSFGPPVKAQPSTDFDANLADHLTDDVLSTVAERILLGVDADIQSRQQWLENMKEGLSLLGLQIKNPKGAATSGGSPQEGVSTVDHPLMLEAVLRFQANARGELLPSDGPVKVRNDGEGNDLADTLAEALEKDLNHYLTKVAKEYYPDTDRMLLLLGFSGISFKKGYHDPIKRRPVIASINAEDLIVSNASTDIDGAGRVTQRIMMKHALMRRMQLIGAYRDIPLSQTMAMPQTDVVKTKINEVQGIAPATYIEPTDQDRELYETYCEIEIPGFEHTFDDEKTKQKKLTGLPLPYKVTIDKEARTILEIRRNWEEDDLFCMPRNRFIAYIFVPGLGFYGIGLLNILGNATKAVTAAWRLMIDAGMFANFPGFLYLKSLAKQLTNQFRVPPGGGMPIDTVGNDIRASIMPLPYKDPSAVFIQLIENVVSTAQRVGGTAELQIGEGKQDAPVGTTLALIEQATKLMSAVHKRLHQAQGQEFDMLKSLLMEDPAALWRHNKKSKVLKLLTAQAGQQPVVDAQEQAEDRHRATFLAALSDFELVPAADPNTSSQTERYLKTAAMVQLAGVNPNLSKDAITIRALKVMGVDDPQSLFNPPPDPNAQPQEDPNAITAKATLLAAQARLADSQTKAEDTKIKAQTDQATLASKERIASLGVARELVIHNSEQQAAQREADAGRADQAADRSHKLALAGMAARAAGQRALQGHVAKAHGVGVAQAHEAAMGNLDRAHEAAMGGLDRAHQTVEAARQRQHEIATAPPAEGVAPA